MVPAGVITLATLTYASAVKYSTILTSAMCVKMMFRDNIVLLD